MKAWQASLRFRSRPKLPIILQDEMAECGHACVAMVAYFFGHQLDLMALRRFNQASSRGIVLRQVIHLCEQLGLQTRALRVAMEDIHLIKTPAILHWENNHFVVLKQVKGTKVIVHDPAIGMRVIKKSAFSLAFTGVALEVERAPDFQAVCQQAPFRMWSFFRFVRGMPRLLSLVLLLSVLMEGMQLLNPLFMQYVTDVVVGSNYLSQMYTVGLGFAFFVGCQGLADYIRSLLVLHTTMNVSDALSSSVLKHVLSLPLSFFQHRHLADIQAKFQSIDQLKSKLTTDVVTSVLDGVMILVTFGVMFAYSRILASVVLLTMLMYAGSLYATFRYYKQQAGAAIVLHVKSAASFLETLQGMLPIKCFAKENIRSQLWRNDYIQALNHDIAVAKWQILYRILNQGLFQLEYIGLLCIGAGLVLAQQLSIGMLLAFLAYRLILVNKSSAFMQYLFTYQLVAVQVDRLHDLINQTPELVHHPLDQRTGTKGEISVNAVVFSYHAHDHCILNRISFRIEPGEKVAIIGPSGSGKSTLLKLLMGVITPNSGEILIDGLPLQVFGLDHFRQLTASVMQDDQLFSGSIMDNITFFADDIDFEQLYHVAKMTCIHETIMAMPMGYESLLGQMGTMLSGGQKQRLLLARALYKKPTFLFLDEATSHLDPALEQEINQALKTLQTTQIMVAHRQETIAMADRVIDLSNI